MSDSVEVTKIIYDLADMLLCRLYVTDGNTVKIEGQLSWAPPWGGTIDLVKKAQAWMGAGPKGKVVHVLLTIVPDKLLIYAAGEIDQTHLAIVKPIADVDLSGAVKAFETVDDVMMIFGKGVARRFWRATGTEGQWTEAKGSA